MLQTDLADLVLSASEESPDRLAVVESSGRGRTWLQLEREVASFATGLGGLGILAGHRVMLVIGNRLEFVTSYLGVLRAQVVVVPVNPRSTADELARMIADSGTRLVVADPAALDCPRGVRPGERRPRRDRDRSGARPRRSRPTPARRRHRPARPMARWRTPTCSPPRREPCRHCPTRRS